MKKHLVNYALIFSVVVINAISIIVFKKIDIIAIIASITGVIANTMIANGNITSYYFSIVCNIAYVIIGYNSHLYGTAILQGLFFLPMQIIGFINWNKNLKQKSNIVNTRKMSFKNLCLTVTYTIVLSLIYSIALRLFNDRLPIIDALVTGLSIVGMILTVKRYKEQWLFWITVNVVNIIMWLFVSFDTKESGLIMALTAFVYLVNSIYGYINWNKLTKSV